jgi:hypothetical protein
MLYNENEEVMSLLSQKDRSIVIKALDFYFYEFYPLMSETEKMEVNTLLNWIKLEYQKNEN